jgi:hypothetical protein
LLIKDAVLQFAYVCSRAGFYADALMVAGLALELAPGFEFTHFTIANIYASIVSIVSDPTVIISPTPYHSFGVHF